jgi:membrane fusion protein, copper/silver efflux system
MNIRPRQLAIVAALLLVPVLQAQAQSGQQAEREVLYWYDPMYPQQRFDGPGPSPFMDMDLVPRYADQGSDGTSMRIDPSVTQNLGMRLATVSSETLGQSVRAVGVLGFDQRAVALVQARSGGFVERVYDRAPEDIIAKGAPLADIYVPEWAAAQEEYLVLRDIGEPQLLAAARQRLRLVGMPTELIQALERSGRSNPIWTVTSPIAGMLESLDVREGMTISAGSPLARINGLDSVWLEVAVPESQLAQLEPGQSASARLPAFPGERLEGTITSILPTANLDSRTLRVRVELPNAEQRLRPGMTAEVTLASSEREALMVPSEAVIRTGQRDLVMLALGEGRFRPVEVRLGRDTGDRTEILEGLEAGEQVVTSGQFLLDSEATLRGLTARGFGVEETDAAGLHQGEGTVIGIDDDILGLTHGPFETLNMPGMTMPFPVADLQLLEGIEMGDQVRVWVRETDLGLVIERIEKLPAEAGKTPQSPAGHDHGGHRP